MRDDLARCKFCGLTYHFSDDHTCIKQLESFREIDQAIISTLQAKVEELKESENYFMTDKDTLGEETVALVVDDEISVVAAMNKQLEKRDRAILNSYRAFVIGGSPYCIKEAKRLLSQQCNPAQKKEDE